MRWLAWVLCTLERVTLGLPSLGVMVAVGNHFANCSFPLWVELSMFGCMVSKPVTITQTRIKGRIRCAGQGTAFLRWPLRPKSLQCALCCHQVHTMCVGAWRERGPGLTAGHTSTGHLCRWRLVGAVEGVRQTVRGIVQEATRLDPTTHRNTAWTDGRIVAHMTKARKSAGK